jgi:hypothetical protein
VGTWLGSAGLVWFTSAEGSGEADLSSNESGAKSPDASEAEGAGAGCGSFRAPCAAESEALNASAVDSDSGPVIRSISFAEDVEQEARD